jgi:hypothetical protein
MYLYTPFVVTSSADGESRPIYGGLYTIGGYDGGYFSPHGWTTFIFLGDLQLLDIDMYFAYFLSSDFVYETAVYILVMQSLGVLLL